MTNTQALGRSIAMIFRARVPATLAGLLLLAIPVTSLAQMTLTSDGIADGFTLTTFVSGLPTSSSSSTSNGCCGPFGTASTSSGNILVDSSANGKVYVFTDTDGQTPGSALSSSPFASFASALTNANGTVYASGGLAAPLDSRGGPNAYSLLQLTNAGGIAGTILLNGGAAGVAVDTANGHVIAEGAANFTSTILGSVPFTETLLDINPLTKTSTLITSWALQIPILQPTGKVGDGIVLSADGSTVYVAFKDNNTIVGFNIATGAQVFSVSLGTSTPDGMGIIQNGPLAGEIVSNNNDGTVDLINAKNGTVTLIASGGTRGDYAGEDLLNGTLFLSQTDSVLRLSCGRGCSFVGGTGGGGIVGGTGVPEPATLGLFGLGLLGVQFAQLLRRRR
jgi:hypothetical protein